MQAVLLRYQDEMKNLLVKADEDVSEIESQAEESENSCASSDIESGTLKIGGKIEMFNG